MIYVIDDDEIMCDCIVRACGNEAEVRRFGNAIEAMQALDKEMPSLIFLDILLRSGRWRRTGAPPGPRPPSWPRPRARSCR